MATMDLPGMIIWETPWLLLALWLAPLVGGLLWYGFLQRRRSAAAFLDPVMQCSLMPAPDGHRVVWRAIVLMLAVGCLVVALARPRFGAFLDDVTSRGVDLFVVLDVSRSMLAEDVAPNRLERAKADIVDLLERLKGDRCGLIAFAGAPVVQVPLTTDHTYFRTVLAELGPDSAPRGGTLIGDALRKALEQMPAQHDRDQVIVLITDGEDHDSFPVEAAQQAAERRVKILTVGIGDVAEGARIPQRREDGTLGFVQHGGQEIWSKMDEKTLSEIAVATSGAYIPARTRTYDLGQVYDQHISGLTQGEIRTEKRKRYREQFQLFGCLGVLLLMLDLLLPRGTAVASLRVLVPVVLLLTGGLVPESVAAPPSEIVHQVEEGIRQFRSGEFAKATRLFTDAEKAAPDNFVIQFDRGCAQAAAGEFDAARSAFLSVAVGQDTRLAAEAHYNLGGLAVRQASDLLGVNPAAASPEQRPQGVALLLDAVGSYRDCLRLNSEHTDARHNLELLRLFVKHLEAEWARQDRERTRQQTGLLEFLLLLEQRQQDLWTRTRHLTTEDESPQKRLALREIAEAERQLQEEVAPLQEKLRDEFAKAAAPSGTAGPQPPNASSASGAPDEQLQAMEQLLLRLTDEAGEAMRKSSEKLRDSELDSAVSDQRVVLQKLNEVYMAMAPFAGILQRSLALETELTGADTDNEESSPAAAADPEPGDAESGHAAAPDSAQHSAPADTVPVLIDPALTAWQQSRITDWSQMMTLKAEAELAAAAAQPSGHPPLGESPDALTESTALSPSLAQSPDSDPSGDAEAAVAITDPETGEKAAGPDDAVADPDVQQQAQTRGLEKAVELGPEVVRHSQAAVGYLESQNAAAAAPEQKQALKLLREIARAMPQDEQKPQDKQQQGENEQKDEQKQEQKDGDDQQDKSAKPDTPQEPPTQQQQQEQQQQQQQQQQPEERSSGMSQQQAMSVLRRARERERKHRDLQKQLEVITGRRGKVDRDW